LLFPHLLLAFPYTIHHLSSDYYCLFTEYIDGTQLHSSRKKLGGGVYRVHNKGTAEEYIEYSWYVLEAKLVLHPKIVVSIMSEFVENKEFEQKQDCDVKQPSG